MVKRFLITQHKTTVTHKISDGEEITQELEIHIVFDTDSQIVVSIYGSLEEAQLKIEELEENLKSNPRPRM
ncbi:hypothetical protein M8D54_004971 [Salmonella enterica]|nr:hypothetical protein [Salmonella enterica]EGR6194429.1 hypothetical protein [Salmonella enterica]EHR7428497.1 hypothetical protein [Salmonella enterica]EJF2005553.1 hypothetical protein [Salmonella enterica]EJF2493125.1 hypothetical protein [Salmonella enterica]